MPDRRGAAPCRYQNCARVGLIAAGVRVGAARESLRLCDDHHRVIQAALDAPFEDARYVREVVDPSGDRRIVIATLSTS